MFGMQIKKTIGKIYQTWTFSNWKEKELLFISFSFSDTETLFPRSNSCFQLYRCVVIFTFEKKCPFRFPNKKSKRDISFQICISSVMSITERKSIRSGEYLYFTERKRIGKTKKPWFVFSIWNISIFMDLFDKCLFTD